MTTVAIGLGSNLGDRLDNLQAALSALSAALHFKAVSPVYETMPMYVQEQPSYLNAAAIAETELGPLRLLKLLKETEGRVGRTDGPRNGPREIDLDLIAYGCAEFRFSDGQEDRLVVPHPRTPERGFVLRPLADIAPTLILPGFGRVAELLIALDHQTPPTETQYAVLSL